MRIFGVNLMKKTRAERVIAITLSLALGVGAACLTTGCAKPGHVKVKVISDTVVTEEGVTTTTLPQMCGVIDNISELMVGFKVVDNSDTQVGLKVPTEIPIEFRVDRDKEHNAYYLQEKHGQDNIAINNFLLSAVLMRNMAPCDPENIRLGWETMKLFINVMGKAYGPSRSQADDNALKALKARLDAGMNPDGVNHIAPEKVERPSIFEGFATVRDRLDDEEETEVPDENPNPE